MIDRCTVCALFDLLLHRRNLGTIYGGKNSSASLLHATSGISHIAEHFHKIVNVFQSHWLTNHHVIDGAKAVIISTVDGGKYAARVLHSDPKKDIAMLHVTDAPEGMTFSVARVSQSWLRPGLKAVGIGHHGALKGLLASPAAMQVMLRTFRLFR